MMLVSAGGTNSLASCAPPGDRSITLHFASRPSPGTKSRPERSTGTRTNRRRSALAWATTFSRSTVMASARPGIRLAPSRLRRTVVKYDGQREVYVWTRHWLYFWYLSFDCRPGAPGRKPLNLGPAARYTGRAQIGITPKRPARPPKNPRIPRRFVHDTRPRSAIDAPDRADPLWSRRCDAGRRRPGRLRTNDGLRRPE